MLALLSTQRGGPFRRGTTNQDYATTNECIAPTSHPPPQPPQQTISITHNTLFRCAHLETRRHLLQRLGHVKPDVGHGVRGHSQHQRENFLQEDAYRHPDTQHEQRKKNPTCRPAQALETIQPCAREKAAVGRQCLYHVPLVHARGSSCESGRPMHAPHPFLRHLPGLNHALKRSGIHGRVLARIPCAGASLLKRNRRPGTNLKQTTSERLPDRIPAKHRRLADAEREQA